MSVGQLVLTALWDDDSNEQSGVRVEQADPLIAVAVELWDMAVRGELAFTEAGEGLFAITTTQGVLRYALTGETTDQGRALIARRLPTSGSYE